MKLIFDDPGIDDPAKRYLEGQFQAVMERIDPVYRMLAETLEIRFRVGTAKTHERPTEMLAHCGHRDQTISVATEALSNPDPQVLARPLLEELIRYVDAELDFSTRPDWKTAVANDMKHVPAKAATVLERV